ncbi:MAG: hypothetical protein NC120_06655 [Ruminococcus sp.]|nr:hypothetical protein [Ruminococcus sp.]
MMYCVNCDKEIPVGETYFKHSSIDGAFCCGDCITDYMVYRNMIGIETNTGEDEE